MSLKIQVSKPFYSANIEDSFKRIISTPLGSRVQRPYFGSKIYLLVDKNMDDEWNLDFQKYLFECFYDENHIPWDDRLVPKKTRVVSVDATAGIVVASIEFENENIEFTVGGF